MYRRFLYTVFLFLAMTGSQRLLAQKNVPTGVPFLRVAPDARSGAMGDVGIALSPDANATFWNGAKTVFDTSSGSISANYIPWLKEIADNVLMASIAGRYKLNENSALFGGFRYFDLGQINLTNDGTTVLSSQHPKQYSLEAGYALKISGHLALSLTMRYIHASLLSGAYSGKSYSSGNAVASDVALFYHKLNAAGQGFSAGLTVSNLGTKISYSDAADDKTFLPANLGVGAAYTWVLEEKNRLTLSADANHLLVPVMDSLNTTHYYEQSVASGIGNSFQNKALQAAVGGEYAYNDIFFLRAGYHWETVAAGDLHYVTAGLGIKFSELTINFAYTTPSGNGVSKNPLSNTLRFSLLFDLPGRR